MFLFAFQVQAASFIPSGFLTSISYRWPLQIKASSPFILTEVKPETGATLYKNFGDSSRYTVRSFHRLPLMMRKMNNHAVEFIHRSNVDFFPSTNAAENYLPTLIVYANTQVHPEFNTRRLSDQDVSLFLTEIAKADQNDNDDDLAIRASNGLTFTLEKHQAKAIIYFGRKSRN